MAGKSFSLLRLDLCHWSYHLSSLNVSVNFSVSHLLRRAGNQFLSCYFCVCVCSFFFFHLSHEFINLASFSQISRFASTLICCEIYMKFIL